MLLFVLETMLQSVLHAHPSVAGDVGMKGDPLGKESSLHSTILGLPGC